MILGWFYSFALFYDKISFDSGIKNKPIHPLDFLFPGYYSYRSNQADFFLIVYCYMIVLIKHCVQLKKFSIKSVVSSINAYKWQIQKEMLSSDCKLPHIR